MANDVFRFVTVRPPQRINPEMIEARVVRAYASSGDESHLHRELRQLRGFDGGREKMEERAKQYIASPEFVPVLSKLAIPQGGEFSKLDGWIISRRRPIKLEDLKSEVNRIFGTDVIQLVASQHYKNARIRIADSLIAWTIYRTDDNRVGPQLMHAMRLCGLFERIAATDPGLAAKGAVEVALRATVVLPPDLLPLPDPESKGRKSLLDAHEAQKKRVEKHRKEIIALANRLEVLRLGAEELTRAYEADLMDRRIATAKTSAVSGSEPSHRTDRPDALAHRQPEPVRAAFLSEKHAKKLSDKTKDLLKELEISLDYVDVPKAVTEIEKDTSRAQPRCRSSSVSPMYLITAAARSTR